jgi:glycoside/pentoside/hexuronide:cation symporter, GPH family
LADRISLKEKIGYSLGDAASNFYWKTFEFFLMIFYTDVFGISAAAVGTMLLVTRIADAVADPTMGAIADRTKTRWGHFRPYILWFALPLAVAGVLTFTTPNLGSGAKLVYAYITYSLLMFLYTAVNIPYTALMGVMTPNSQERTSISSIRFIGAFTAGVFVQYFTLRLVKFFGGGNDARGWQLTMVLYGVLAVALLVLCFAEHPRARYPPPQQHSDIKRDLGDLFGSRPWLVLVGVLLMVLAAFVIKGSASAYYFKYFLKRQDLLGAFLVSNGLAFLVAVSITSRLAKWFGKKPLFMIAIGGGGLVIGPSALRDRRICGSFSRCRSFPASSSGSTLRWSSPCSRIRPTMPNGAPAAALRDWSLPRPSSAPRSAWPSARGCSASSSLTSGTWPTWTKPAVRSTGSSCP